MFDILITNGRIIDGSGLPWFQGDIGITNDKILAIGKIGDAEAKLKIDARNLVVCPGFVDAHVHGDLMLLADPLHEPAIRQGVTTYIIGQDGSSMAPASPVTLEYMKKYTAGFNGIGDLADRWSTVAEYLEMFGGRTALNVAYLIPNGNVRMEAMGLETRRPNGDELKSMRRLVREGMEQGACGLSSGLDYIPSRYADTDELAALCEEIASFGGVYVTHMRSYDRAEIAESMEEVFRIGREAGCPVHISHFNCRAEDGLAILDQARADGIDATYDLYCYLAGSTILSMIALPPWTMEGGIQPTLARLSDSRVRAELKDWFAAPRVPLEKIALSFIPKESFQELEGKHLPQAAESRGQPIGDFICDLLVQCNLLVGCIVPHRDRTENDVIASIQHPCMMAGSDGIFIGGRPHPRGWGCFARYLDHYVRQTHALSLEEAVSKMSYHAARRFGLKDRGLLREHMAADIVIFDPESIREKATYANGRQLAEGIQHVIVNGKLVLRDGARTAALPGRPLRPQ